MLQKLPCSNLLDVLLGKRFAWCPSGGYPCIAGCQALELLAIKDARSVCSKLVVENGGLVDAIRRQQ